MSQAPRPKRTTSFGFVFSLDILMTPPAMSSEQFAMFAMRAAV